jgi:hypothetical protein
MAHYYVLFDREEWILRGNKIERLNEFHRLGNGSEIKEEKFPQGPTNLCLYKTTEN